LQEVFAFGAEGWVGRRHVADSSGSADMW
jgi:hypothetical protein